MFKRQNAKAGNEQATKPQIDADAAEVIATDTVEEVVDADVSENRQSEGLSSSADLPDMYRKVSILMSEAHGDLRFSPPDTYPRAASMPSVILAFTECAEAAFHYPLVFTERGGNRALHAVTGYSSGENKFIDDAGNWRPGTYVPAYVRRYPFILVEDKESGQLMLACDMKSDNIGKETGAPLFEDGEPSEVARDLLSFCVSYHRELLQTQKIIDEIAKAGILVERTANLTLPNENRHKIDGFQIIDEEKFNDLGGVALLELRRNNALPLIYTHLISMRNWQKLANE